MGISLHRCLCWEQLNLQILVMYTVSVLRSKLPEMPEIVATVYIKGCLVCRDNQC
jgi:hypothetical protein